MKSWMTGKSFGIPDALKLMACQFVDRGAAFYDAQHRKLQIDYLKRKAANLGFQIIEAPAA